MKKKFFLIPGFLLAMAVTGCQQTEPPMPLEDGARPAVESAEPENPVLEENLKKLVNLAEEKGSAYLVFGHEDNYFDVVSEEDYQLASALAEIIMPDSRAPEGSGWKYVGTASSKVAAYGLARKIAGQISEDMDFEVHVESINGVWHVWYRII